MADIYQFGRFELNPATRQLLADNQPAPIGSRAFDVLHALIERRERLVTKEELLNLVWPGVVVEENNLQVQISALRKLLGVDVIATVAGRGYRFTRDVANAGLPPASKPHHVTNLPQDVSSFIGRKDAVIEINKRLSDTRLLTLTGVGGIGKTRLAAHVAAALLDDYLDGIWFVELASITDPQLIPQAVASTLGVIGSRGQTVEEALSDYLSKRHALLILDNCEHLLRACAQLASLLLRTGRQITILATSREPLMVTGEVTFVMQPLAYPKSDAVISPEAFLGFEAMQLFIARASAANSSFKATKAQCNAIGEICRRLDGIPLAIELAAARVRAISVESIAERLFDRFRLLTSGNPTVLPRQQTLLACMAWSYELLADAEQGLLQRLTVFAGGWTLDAALAIVRADMHGVDDISDLLFNLVSKSLVEFEPRTARYFLLETVREYVLTKIDDPTLSETRERHLVFFEGVAQQAAGKLRGPEHFRLISRMTPEKDNFIAAHQWNGVAEERAMRGLALVSDISELWKHRGEVELGRRLCVEALKRPGAERPSMQRCAALCVASSFDYFLADYRSAKCFAAESLEIAKYLKDEHSVVLSLRLLGDIAHAQGDKTMAERHFEEAFEISRFFDNKAQLGSVMNSLAELHRSRGALESANALYEQALEICRALGDREGEAIKLLNMAMVATGQKRYGIAASMLSTALTIIDETGSKPIGAIALEVAIGLFASLQEYRRAAWLHGAATAVRGTFGTRCDAVDQEFLSPLIAMTQAELNPEAFSEREREGASFEYEAAVIQLSAWLAERISTETQPSGEN